MNKNVVVYFDEARFNHDLLKLETAKDSFQSLLNEFNQLGFPKVDMAGLISLAQQGEAFIKSLLESQMPEQSFGIFKMSKKKAVEMLELPDLSKLLTLARAASPEAWIARDLVCNGKTVSIDAKAPESLKTSNSIKAETADQVKLYQAHQRLTEAIADFNTHYHKVYGRILRHDEPIQNLVRITQESKTETTIVEAVKKLSNRFFNKETGEPLEEIIEPAHTRGNTTWLDPEVKLNDYFYQTNRFPIAQ
jgi:hypothetical protein